MTTPTLFFPGSPSTDADADARPWRAGADARGVAVELVGVDRRGGSIAEVATRAVGLVDGPVRVLGVSGGGPFALATAALAGERVERVTVVSGFPPPEHGLGPLAGAEGLDVGGVRSWARALLEGLPGADAETMLDGFVADVLALREPWPFDPSSITAPTTFLHAVDDDRCSIAGMRAVAAVIPGARVVEWDAGGHLAVLLRADDVLAVL